MTHKKLIVGYLQVATLLTGYTSPAQIPVNQEAHHKIVLQNSYIRVLRGRIPYNDTTVAHIHAANSVIVFMSKSRYGIKLGGEKVVVADVVPGDTKYVNYGDNQVTHRVWNQGLLTFEFFVVELKKRHLRQDTCSMITQHGLELKWQEKLVKAYHVAIIKAKPFKFPTSTCAYLLISISGRITIVKSHSERTYQPKSVIFFPARSDIQINNYSNKTARCVLLQIY